MSVPALVRVSLEAWLCLFLWGGRRAGWSVAWSGVLVGSWGVGLSLEAALKPLGSSLNMESRGDELLLVCSSCSVDMEILGRCRYLK